MASEITCARLATVSWAYSFLEKSDDYVEEKQSLEEEKERVAQAEEQFKTSVKEMEEKLASTEKQLEVLEAEKQEREAKALFNSRMTELDEIYDMDDSDRKIIASELVSLDQAETGYDDFKTKLEAMWNVKTKVFKEEQQALIQKRISDEVAKALDASKAEADVPTLKSESTEEILDHAEVEEETVPNNSAEISKQEQTLSDQFKSVFNRDNVNIKY
jgi:phage shock protein A